MSGLHDLFYDELVWLHAHMRPMFVTREEFLDWRARDPAAVDYSEAEDFARFVKSVAIESRCSNLVGAADSILRVARVILDRPHPCDPETGRELETLPHDHWQAMLDRQTKREGERRDRPERWAQKDRVTTSDIANLLWPDERPGFAASYVFFLLKECGYVEGAARNWRLTDKGKALGEERGPRRFIYWSKSMLEVVRAEVERKRLEGLTSKDPGEPPGP